MQDTRLQIAALWAISFLATLLIGLPSLAGLMATPLHEGAFSARELTWQVDADGRYTPRLPGTQELEESGQPVLVLQQLDLLVPANSPVVGIEVVPLATRAVFPPGSLRLGAPALDDRGMAVVADSPATSGSCFPELWGQFAGSHIWHGYRWISVLVYPLHAIRDAQGEWTGLEVLERYAVHTVTDPAAPLPAIARRERLVPGERQRLESTLKNLCTNAEALTGYERADGVLVEEPAGGFHPARTPSLTGSSVRYLIITSEELASAFQVLADHKTALGIPAVVKTVEWIADNYRQGADIQETVRGFIREAYQRWGVEYVLLGADTDILPARLANNTFGLPGSLTEIPADLYFACLDGNWDADGDHLFGEAYVDAGNPGDDCDFAQEVVLGRYPVSTPAGAAAVVSKIMTYEHAEAGSAWTNRNLLAAEVLTPSDYHPGDSILIDGATYAQGIVDSSIVPCTSMGYTRMYEATQLWPGSVPLTRLALIDTLNTGHYGIFSQIGHGFYFNMSVGDGNFILADADALTNGDHPFVIYALNCASAAFDQTCLMERLLENPDGGAVVAIGATRGAYPLNANNYQQQFFKQLNCHEEHRVGDLVQLSRLPYLTRTFYNTLDRWTQLNYTLLGDPSLPLWTDTVGQLMISGPSSLPVGAQNVTLQITSQGSPVAGALVCLTKPGEDYVVAESDLHGTANLFFMPTSAGSAILTVTAKNLALTEQTLPVSLSGAYIATESMTIVDDGTSGSSGNGDGVPEAGETAALWLTCRDTGSGGATGCVASLTSVAPGVTILDGTAMVGDVPSGGIKAATDPFLVRFADSMGDGTNVEFFVVVVGNGGRTSASTWSTTVLAPEVEPVELIWADTPFGNGNGVQENHERVTIRLRLKNYGTGLADVLTAHLRTSDSQIVLYDTTATYSALDLLDTSFGDRALSFADTDVGTDSWCWILCEDNYGRRFRHDFHLAALQPPLDLQGDSSQGPDVIAVTWTPSGQEQSRGYNVERSLQESGPFTRVNRDLVEGISYFRDAGLFSLTRYFYRVTAVDSSLTESVPSVVLSLSTSPRELSGFPLPYALESNSNCAVGDVNGDGILDIVMGADEIYVWNAYGEELFDGDANAQTHGPITDFDSDFQPAGVALAALVGAPGMQIIACERNWTAGNQNAVHIFRADGSEMPGWPQILLPVSNGWSWATPAVGDVDADGSPEIVVNTLDSRTWVWHVDGTELRDGDNDPATNGVFLNRGLPQEWAAGTPALADLDGDGASDIIFGSKASNELVTDYLHAYRYDGSEVAGFPYSTHSGNITCSPAVADLDQDGSLEIVFFSNDDSLHVVRQDGTRYDGFPIHFVSNTDVIGPSPALGDLDGDGQLEIVAVSTVAPDESDLYILDTDVAGGTSGQPLPGWPRTLPGLSEGSPVVGDLDGDGSPDILFGIGGGATESPNDLYAFKADGDLVSGFPITLGGPFKATPTICDLDRDGDVDLVVEGWDLLIHVWDMPFPYVPANIPWRTFHGNNFRDGLFRPGSLVSVPESTVPERMTLLSPYPNPFNPSATVRLYVPGAAGGAVDVTVGVYDLQGRLLRQLHQGPAPSGWNSWIWDGRDGQGRSQASGVYVLRAASSDRVSVAKMSLVK